MIFSLSRCTVVVTLSALFVGCGEEPASQPTVINPVQTAAPSASATTNYQGIPSSGGKTKKKPDMVGVVSPIVPPTGR